MEKNQIRTKKEIFSTIELLHHPQADMRAVALRELGHIAQEKLYPETDKDGIEKTIISGVHSFLKRGLEKEKDIVDGDFVSAALLLSDLSPEPEIVPTLVKAYVAAQSDRAAANIADTLLNYANQNVDVYAECKKLEEENKDEKSSPAFKALTEHFKPKEHSFVKDVLFTGETFRTFLLTATILTASYLSSPGVRFSRVAPEDAHLALQREDVSNIGIQDDKGVWHITYSCSHLEGNQEINEAENFSLPSDALKEAIKQALSEFERPLNIKFHDINSEEAKPWLCKESRTKAHIVYRVADIINKKLDCRAAAFESRSFSDGVIFSDITLGTQTFNKEIETEPGSAAFSILLHEIGHALGLAHPFKDDEKLAHSPRLNIVQSYIFPHELDSVNHTVMSYSSSNKHKLGGQIALKQDGYSPSTLMLFDIQTLAKRYGINPSYNRDNTEYIYLTPLEESSNRNIYTRVDRGGVDTIHVKAMLDKSVLVDLREGPEFKSLILETASWNAYGSNIENVKIAFGPDETNAVAGNHLDNMLDAGKGRNVYYPGSGKNTMVGSRFGNLYIVGEGHDTITGDFDPKRDSFLVSKDIDLEKTKIQVEGGKSTHIEFSNGKTVIIQDHALSMKVADYDITYKNQIDAKGRLIIHPFIGQDARIKGFDVTKHYVECWGAGSFKNYGREVLLYPGSQQHESGDWAFAHFTVEGIKEEVTLPGYVISDVCFKVSQSTFDMQVDMSDISWGGPLPVFVEGAVAKANVVMDSPSTATYVFFDKDSQELSSVKLKNILYPYERHALVIKNYKGDEVSSSILHHQYSFEVKNTENSIHFFDTKVDAFINEHGSPIDIHVENSGAIKITAQNSHKDPITFIIDNFEGKVEDIKILDRSRSTYSYKSSGSGGALFEEGNSTTPDVRIHTEGAKINKSKSKSQERGK